MANIIIIVYDLTRTHSGIPEEIAEKNKKNLSASPYDLRFRLVGKYLKRDILLGPRRILG